jgi:hypothetical protein
MTQSYEIPEANLASLIQRLGKLNKRANKLGVQPILVTQGAAIARQLPKNQYDPSEKPRFRNWIPVTVDGVTPKLNGWSFMAVLEPVEGGVFIRKTPECKIDLAAYRHSKPVCDHCQLVRNRKQTYLLRHEDGSIRQIGSSCILDFLGGADPHHLASISELWFSITEIFAEEQEERETGGRCSRDLVSIVELLEQTAQVLLHTPYISKTAARAAQENDEHVQSTASLVSEIIFPPTNVRDRDMRDHPYNNPDLHDITESAKVTAEAARAMVLETLTPKDVNDTINEFESNLLTAAKCEVVPTSMMGVACYIIPFYIRELERIAKKELAGEMTEHYGQVGNRCKNVEITYLSSSGFEGTFGYTFIHRFHVNKSLLVWKTGTDSLSDLEPGKKVFVTFTVKDHGEYKGTKQTAITRCLTGFQEKPKKKSEGALVSH